MHCLIFFSYELCWCGYNNVCLKSLFRSVWFVSSIIIFFRYHLGAVPSSFADFKEFMIAENDRNSESSSSPHKVHDVRRVGPEQGPI